MRWLQQFKEVIDKQLDVTDSELYRAFPELEYSSERMDAALMYWRYDFVAPEFKEQKKTLWKRILNFLNGRRSSDTRAAV